MTALACYFDESFRDEVHVVAGYLAPVESWDQLFAPAWEKTLRNAPHHLTEFRAVDCRHRRGEFSTWTPEECVALTTSLVSVIIEAIPESDCIGFGTALVYPGVVDPTAECARKGRRNLEGVGYGISLGMCLYDSLNVGTRACAIDDVQPVVDEKGRFFARIARNFDAAVSCLEPELARKVKRPVTGNSKVLLPLQAADLLAHETHKEVWNRCEGRNVSTALERLVGSRYHRARCLSYGGLEEYLSLRDAGVRPSPSAAILFETGSPIRAPGHWRAG